MTRKHETLTSLFEDIANSIRSKKQTTESIKADDFPDEIDSIPVGVFPSGILEINYNGYYDVEEFKTVYVNCKDKYIINNLTDDNENYFLTDSNAELLTSQPGVSQLNETQYSPVVGRVTNNTSYTSTDSKILVEETGRYKCTWMHYAAASSSQYYLSRLYVGNTAVGSTHAAPAYSNTNPDSFVAIENSIDLTAGQTIEVRARTRSGTSYYTVAGMLVIEKIN